MPDCTNPDHDHALEANDEPGRCNDCRVPSHYDAGTGWYHHDDDSLPGCLLTDPHSVPGHTPCSV